MLFIERRSLKCKGNVSDAKKNLGSSLHLAKGKLLNVEYLSSCLLRDGTSYHQMVSAVL